MNTSNINWPIVKRLIIKDWQLFEKQMAACVLAGFFALCLIGMAKQLSFYFGALLLIIIMVAVPCFSISSSIINERKDRTLPFVMSLPIKPLDYFLSKLLGNLMNFAVPMALLALACIGVIFLTVVPNGLVVYTLLLFGYISLAFCLSLSMALAVESEGWSIFFMIAPNVMINPYIMGLGQIPEIVDPLKTDVIVWSWQALAILGTEAIIGVSILLMTAWYHCRKRAFM
jgi:ABC-2 type transport system permease protein